MSNYSQTTFFTPKDSLPTTNPAKTIFGAAYDVEFGNISTAIATKYDSTQIATSPVAFNLGTTALPGITFVGHTGTGFSSDSSGDLFVSTGGVQQVEFVSGGGVVVGTATGGSQGAGTINATGLYVNGANLGNILASNNTWTGTNTFDNAVTINVTSGQGLTIAGAISAYAAVFNGNTSTGNAYGVAINGGSNAADTALNINNAGSTAQYFNIRGDGSVSIGGASQAGPGTLSIAKSLTAATISTAAQHSLLSSTQNLPGAGAFASNAYLLIGGSGGNYLAFGQNPNTSNDPYAQWIQSGFSSTSSVYYDIALNPVGGGVTINGNPIYAGIPVNQQSNSYTTVAADNGKNIFNTVTGKTVTLSTAATPVGGTITITNGSAVTTTITVSSGTLYFSPSGGTGNRTLAGFGVATATQLQAGVWIITGTGLT